MEFSISIDIAAPVERVWAVMTDVEAWPEWTSSVTSIKRLDQGPFRTGSRVRVRQPKLLPALWRVIEVDPGRSFTWQTVSPGVWVTADHAVEPIAGGTRATLSLQFGGVFGRPVARLTRDLNNRYLKLEADGLKRRSETGAPGATGATGA